MNLFSIQEEWVFLIPSHTFNCMAKKWPKLFSKILNCGVGLVTHFNICFVWAQLGAFLIHSFCIVFPSMQRLQATHAQNAAIFIFRTSSMGSPVAKWPRQLHKEHVLSAGCYAHVRSGSGGSKRTTVGGRGVESSHYI